MTVPVLLCTDHRRQQINSLNELNADTLALRGPIGSSCPGGPGVRPSCTGSCWSSWEFSGLRFPRGWQPNGCGQRVKVVAPKALVDSDPVLETRWVA